MRYEFCAPVHEGLALTHGVADLQNVGVVQLDAGPERFEAQALAAVVLGDGLHED